MARPILSTSMMSPLTTLVVAMVCLLAILSSALLVWTNLEWRRLYADYIPIADNLEQARNSATRAFLLLVLNETPPAGPKAELIHAYLDNAEQSTQDARNERSTLIGLDAHVPDETVRQALMKFEASLAAFVALTRTALSTPDNHASRTRLAQISHLFEAERVGEQINTNLAERLSTRIGHHQEQERIGLGLAVASLLAALLLMLKARKQEAIAKRQEHLMRGILNASSDAIFVKDTNGRYLLLNDGATRLASIPADQYLGKTDREIFSPADAARIMQNDRVIITQRLTKTTEEQVTLNNGNNLFLSSQKGPLLNDNGEIYGLYGISRDISARIQAEQALKASEARFRNLFENNQVAMLLIDPAEGGAIVDANPAAEVFFGWSQAQLRTMRISEINLLSPDDVRIEMERARAGKKQHFEFRHRRADGTICDVDVHSASVRLDDREILCSFVHDATERKQVEQALRSSEERFRHFMDHSPTVAWIKDAVGRHVYVNKPFEQTLGVPFRGWHLKTNEEIFPPEIASALSLRDEEVLALGHPVEADEKTEDSRGFLRIWRTVKFPFSDEDGSRFVGGIAMEITEQRQAERALQEMNERFAAIFRGSPIGISVTSQEGAILDINPAALTMFGYEREEMIGHTVRELDLYVEPAQRTDLIRIAKEQERANNLEIRFRRKDGEVFTAQCSADLIDLGGTPHLLTLLNDISYQKAVEAELARYQLHLEKLVSNRTVELEAARNQLQLLLDTLPAMVSYWTPDLINQFANQAHRNWLSVEAHSIPGRPMGAVLGPSLFEVVRPYAQAALRGEEQHFELTIPCPGGHGARHALASMIPDIGGTGHVRGFLTVVEDVTEIKQAEQSAITARRAAERLAATRSQFLANMSHEIRTPMNGIMGYLQLLELSSLGLRERDLVDKIKRTGDTLLGIINDVLDFSRIEAGRIHLEQTDFLLSDVQESLTALMATMSSREEIELIMKPIPPTARRLVGDPLRLEQVLTNLVSNAIKFTRRGSVSVGVSVEESSEALVRLHFTVTDTGVGIQADKLQEIFQSFTQADTSTTRQFGGSGLGLAISRRLVTLMGGQIGVNSEPGEGSTFWVSLPFARGGESEAQPQPLPLTGLRLLIADDHSEALDALGATARDLGAETVSVNGGQAAIEAVLAAASRGNRFDTLILDGRMPNPDGLAVIKTLHGSVSEPLPPIVLMTSSLGRSDVLKKPGAELIDAVVVKPMTAMGLVAAVAEARQRRTLETQGPTAPHNIPKRLAGMRVLVADDSDINQEVAARILKLEGAEVRTADNGQDALDLLRADPAGTDLVLMDVQMPIMDGYTTVRLIRQDASLCTLPVIALTAGAFKEERDTAFASGMNGFVVKPFNRNALVTELLRCAGTTGQAAATDDATARPDCRAAVSAAPLPGQAPGRPLLAAETGLEDWGDPEVYARYLRRFAETYGSVDHDLEALLADGDRPAATKLAHTLKGTAGSLALLDLAHVAEQLERTLKDGADCRDPLENLRSALPATLEAVAAYSRTDHPAPIREP